PALRHRAGGARGGRAGGHRARRRPRRGGGERLHLRGLPPQRSPGRGAPRQRGLRGSRALANPGASRHGRGLLLGEAGAGVPGCLRGDARLRRRDPRMAELPGAAAADAGKEERIQAPRTRFRRRTDRFFLTEQAGRTLPLVLTDQNGNIRSWSRGAADLYGLSEAEAIGARWAAVTGEDALPEEP